MGIGTEAGTTPRGARRLLYVSDPSSIALNVLPDPVEPDDLRRWVDVLADSGVDTFVQDVYNQGFTVYWRSERLQYDQRDQHRRFLPMLDAGIQPLQVLMDQSHERDMDFVAGFRMNDTHDFPAYADFITAHPEWHLPKPWEVRAGDTYQGGKPLDFTFEPVREFVLSFMRELVEAYDVDGLELCFRDYGYFPVPHGRERAHLMSDLVRRLRGLLDDRSRSSGRRVLLGARVFSSLDECLDMGLDVPTWVEEGFVDYLSPEDTMYSDFNAPYAEFGDLTRDSDCRLYPGMHPWTSHRMRRKSAMTPSMCRALAYTFYAGEGDGVSIFNHFVGHLWRPPFYPQALRVFHELRDPARIARGERHYVFDPTWAGVDVFGPARSTSGVVKAQRVVLDRGAASPSGAYPFRLYEEASSGIAVSLLFRGAGLTSQDELEAQLNGVTLAPGPLGRPSGPALDRVPDTRWFPVPPELVAWGDNQLRIALTSGDPDASGEITIDEVEVCVQPI